MADTSSHIEEDVAPRSVIALKHASNGETDVEIRYILQNWQYKDVIKEINSKSTPRLQSWS